MEQVKEMLRLSIKSGKYDHNEDQTKANYKKSSTVSLLKAETSTETDEIFFEDETQYNVSAYNQEGTIDIDFSDLSETIFEQNEVEYEGYDNEEKEKHIDFASEVDGQSLLDKSSTQTSFLYSQSMDTVQRKRPSKITDQFRLSILSKTSDDSILTLISSSSDGTFVHPLTGERQVYSATESTESIESIQSTEIKAREKRVYFDSNIIEPLEEFVFKDYDSMYLEIPVINEQFSLSSEDIFLINRDQSTDDIPQVISYKKRENEVGVEFSVEEFLVELMDDVARLLSKKLDVCNVKEMLDKIMLFEELKKIRFITEIEQKVNDFLSMKASIYYNHYGKGHFVRYSTLHNSGDVYRYKDICHELDQLLGRQAITKYKSNSRIDELSVEMEKYEGKLKKELQKFENMIRKTLKCDARPRLDMFVSQELEKIAQLREEISQTRSIVICQQHRLSTLQRKKHEIEYIGDGLCMTDFENLWQEIKQLEKRLENRGKELSRMHNRFQNESHHRSHLKMRSIIIYQQIRMVKKSFHRLKIKTAVKRQKLFQKRLQRRRTRQQLEELRWRCGILDKPALLKDFDDTLELLTKKHDVVKKLRKKFTELTKDVEKYEKQSSSFGIKSKMSMSLKSNPSKLLKSKGFV